MLCKQPGSCSSYALASSSDNRHLPKRPYFESTSRKHATSLVALARTSGYPCVWEAPQTVCLSDKLPCRTCPCKRRAAVDSAAEVAWRSRSTLAMLARPSAGAKWPLRTSRRPSTGRSMPFSCSPLRACWTSHWCWACCDVSRVP